MSRPKLMSCLAGAALAASTLFSAAQMASNDPGSKPDVAASQAQTTSRNRMRLQEGWINSSIDIPAILADPTIKNFVGLAENAWDFNAPDGVPGFGPLRPTDDVARLLAQAVGREAALGLTRDVAAKTSSAPNSAD